MCNFQLRSVRCTKSSIERLSCWPTVSKTEPFERAAGIKVLETIKEGATVYRRDDAKKAAVPSSCAGSDVCFKMASDVLCEAGVIDTHLH